jgi:hypothetical protein
MRPRLILLLVLLTLTVTFMAFLVKDQEKKMVCSKGNCGEQQPPAVPTSGGGSDEMDNGSFHHLIVSTIK